MSINNPTKNETNFDQGPEEPELYKLIGFDDCKFCYFRVSTVERITRDTEKLQRGD